MRQATPPADAADAEIRILRPEDVRFLRLGPHRRANEATVRQIVTTYPNRSVWSPETLEYALVAPWRHRPEVALIEELAAVRHARPLLAAAVENSRRAGDAIALVLEMEERRHAAFYARAGLQPIEDVITYDLSHVRPISMPARMTFTPADPPLPLQMEALLRIDHAAFPWLWWNSAEEFLVYGESPGTELHLGWLNGHPVAYVGISIFPGWGHLDRIAVDPTVQGHGLGRQTLVHAINTMHSAGARRIALSTQSGNQRSQHLYERFGFRRSPGFDYRLYGAPMRMSATELTAANGRHLAGAENGPAGDDTNRWAAVSGKSSS